jgi:hypothetical protein
MKLPPSTAGSRALLGVTVLALSALPACTQPNLVFFASPVYLGPDGSLLLDLGF